MSTSSSPPSPPSPTPAHTSKPDIRKANVCPPMPKDAKTMDRLLYWLGIGLGSGLPRRAPGTWGSLAGLILGVALLSLGFWAFLLITLAACVIGIFICQRTSELMRVHDDPHIVWDEWVGMWLAMLPMAYLDMDYRDLFSHDSLGSWIGVILAFVLFRFFDIVKPPPIAWADRQVSGGLGIMLDDILAGLMAVLVWSLIIYVLVRWFWLK